MTRVAPGFGRGVPAAWARSQAPANPAPAGIDDVRGNRYHW